MQQQSILLPMFALVGLTFLVWVRMYQLRIGYLRSNRINPDKYKLRQGYEGVPSSVMATSDNLMNLFEIPVLFYAAVLTLYITHTADSLFVIMAWTFVSLRIVHSAIHITYNRVVHRFTAYFIGTLVLWCIWARLVYTLTQ
ncbi:MAG: MAPEG family protein [Acidiferrobacterales bacterium]|nr:MAPEG family protein [Acidiferrobacterales bacterium]